MLEPSLAHLGLFLADTFEIKKTQIAYTDRDSIFRHLSEKSLSLTLPAATYYNTNISQTGSAISHRRGPITYNINVSKTLASTYEFIPIKVSISCGLLASNIQDYLDLSRCYFKLLKNSTFSVELKTPKVKTTIQLSLSEVSELSTPPEGKEGKDFDRGVFYVLEGGFSLNTFILYSEDYKLIRNIETTWEIGTIN